MLVFEAVEREIIGCGSVCVRGIIVGTFGIERDWLRKLFVNLERILLFGGVCFIIAAF